MAESNSGLLNSAEWAAVNGVSARRARQLATAGLIPARKSGGSWLIDSARCAPQRRGRHGRPLSERSCWAIIDILNGAEPPRMSRTELARARRRAAGAGSFLPGELAARADVLSLRAHPGVLDALSGDERLVIAGAQAAFRHGADLIGISGLELYAVRGDLDALSREYALRPAQDDANVILRLASRLPAASGRIASAAVAAFDLLDAGDERSVRAARQLLRRIVG